jgi:hypothetical protein
MDDVTALPSEKKKQLLELLSPEQSEHIESLPPAYKKVFLEVFVGAKSFPKLLKAKCLDCTCYQREEITLCQVRLCPLWKYRPYQKKQL